MRKLLLLLLFPSLCLATSANVRDWGARGNGLADDSNAFQNAVEYIENTGGGVLRIPQGNYLLDSTVTVTSNDVSIEGDGKNASVITYDGTGDAIYYSTPNFNTTRGGYFEHFGVTCSNNSETGLHVMDEHAHLYEDLSFTGCGNGMLLENAVGTWSEENKLSQVLFLNNVYGLHAKGNGAGNTLAYSNLDFYCERNNPALAPTNTGSCLYVDDLYLYNSHVFIRENLPGSVGPDTIQVDDFGKISDSDITVYGEGGDGQPVLAVGDAAQVTPPSTNPVVWSSHVWGDVNFLAPVGQYPPWPPNTPITAGTIKVSSCPNQDLMIALNNGTTGSSTPSWNCGNTGSISLGLTTQDNGITWRDEGREPGFNGGIARPITALYVTGSSGHDAAVYLENVAPTGSCNTGDLDLNPNGVAGTTMFVCVGGAWVNVK